MIAIKKLIVYTAVGAMVFSGSPFAEAALVDSVSVSRGTARIEGSVAAKETVGIYTMHNDAKDYGKEEASLEDIKSIDYVQADSDGFYSYKTQVDDDDIIYISSQSGENTVIKSSDYVSNFVYEVYISPDGDDATATGTSSKPYKTVEAAQKLVREFKSSGEYTGGDIAINFMPGTYRISDRIYIGAKDSGSENGKIVYRSVDGEAVLTHSKEIPVSGFGAVTDNNILKRLPTESVGKVLEMDLNDYIPEDDYLGYGVLKIMKETRSEGVRGFSRLYLNDKRQTISRWPNVGYKDFLLKDGSSSIIKNEAAQSQTVDGATTTVPGEIVLKYDESNPDRWGSAKDMAIRGYFSQAYWGYAYAVNGIDFDNKEMSLENVYTRKANVLDSFTGKRRWYAENLLEEIDMPGEYYIDESTRKLYYYPAYELKDSDKLELVSGISGRNLVALESTSYITIEGLTIDKSMYKGIVITNSENIVIDSCNISNTQSGGIEASYGKTRNVTIRNNNIYNTNFNGINICANSEDNTGLTDEEYSELTPTGFVIENNHIYNTGLDNHYMTQSITLSGIGDVVRNNTIHRTPLAGLGFHSTGGKASYNEIYKAVYDTTDTGAMHVGGDWHKFGMKVEYNYFHDLGIENFDTSSSTWPIAGIYWDELQSVTEQNYNIIVNDSPGGTKGLYMNGGRNHTAKGNVFVGNEYAFYHPDTHSSYAFVYNSADTRTVYPWHSGVASLDTVFRPFYNMAKENNSPFYQKYGDIMDELIYDIDEKDRVYSAKNLDFTDNVLIDNDHEAELMRSLSADGKLIQWHYEWDAENNKSLYEVRTINNYDTVKLDNYSTDAARSEIFADAENGDYRVTDAGKEKLGITGDFELDTSFNLQSIGCDWLPELGDEFRKLYPAQNTVTDSREVNLVWEPALYADEYDWYVYDSNGNTVKSGTTMYTNTTVELEPDTEYLWEVRARYTSAVAKAKNKCDTAWQSTGGKYSFRTSSYNILVKNASLSADKTKLYFDYNNQGASTDASVILASYNEDGYFLGCKIIDKTFVGGEVLDTLETSGYVTEGILKAFIWNKDENGSMGMIPLANATLIK